MRTLILSLLFAVLFVGCATTDPIDHLSFWLTHTETGQLADSHSGDLFPNGPWATIALPATAEPKSLASEALAAENWRRPTDFTMLKMRHIRIVCKGMERVVDPNYTAILVATKSGQKIALLQYHHDGWLSRVYDAK